MQATRHRGGRRWAAVLCGLVIGTGQALAAQEFDIVIRNGRVARQR